MAKKEKKEPVFRIGVILAEQGLTNEVFADLIGVNKGTVSEWVNHKVYPDPSKLPLISKLLNVNMQHLLLETKPIHGKSPAQIEAEKRENAN